MLRPTDSSSSESLTRGTKRPASALANVDALCVLKAAKIASKDQSRPSKKLALRDFQGIVKNIIGACQRTYRCKIFTIDAFPDIDQELLFVMDSWNDECHRRKITVEMDEDFGKLVRTFSAIDWIFCM